MQDLILFSHFHTFGNLLSIHDIKFGDPYIQLLFCYPHHDQL